MSAVFELSENESLFEREKQRFLASLAKLDDEVPGPNRRQNRALPAAPLPRDSFENTPDTDPSLPANRDWGRAILGRVATSTLGNAAVEAATINDDATLNAVIDTAVEKGKAWGALSGAERAEILHRAGDVLEARRADLLEVMASETGKTIDQGDPEVSEAVDFAHYYAESARKLDDVDGATFVPAKLTVVTPPWNFPVAIPAGSTLAALAAGLRRRDQARQAGPPQRCRHDRGPLGGRRSPRRPHHGPAGRARARPAADLPPGRGPRHPDRRLRDRRAVPLLPQGPAPAGRDQRQERHHRHPERGPGPRGQGRRVLRIRPRRPEVLRRLAGDPRRLRGEIEAVPQPADRRRHLAEGRLPARTRPARWARSSSPPAASS